MNGILLDTHVLIWWAENPTLLSHEAMHAIEENADQIYVSHVSAWEVHIKQNLGKLSLPMTYEEILSRSGFLQLPIKLQHINMIKSLPSIHNDPFDRLLISQALIENLTLVTHDRDMMKYHVPLIKT